MTEPGAAQSDTVLSARLPQQDECGFHDLVAAHHATMLTVARAIIGEAFAEEVVQEAWVSVYRSLPKFEGRSSLKTWIYRIVSNEAISRLRKESRQVPLDDIDSIESSYSNRSRFTADGFWRQPPPHWGTESPEALLEEEDLRKCIERTLTILPTQQKAAFLLRDVEQLPLNDLCNILQVSDSNIRVLLHRARLKLMEVIDHYQETGEC